MKKSLKMNVQRPQMTFSGWTTTWLITGLPFFLWQELNVRMIRAGILCNFPTWDCWGLHVKQWPVDGAQSSPKMYAFILTFRPTFFLNRERKFLFLSFLSRQRHFLWQWSTATSPSEKILTKYYRCVTLWTPIKICLMTNYRSAQSKITLFLTFRFRRCLKQLNTISSFQQNDAAKGEFLILWFYWLLGQFLCVCKSLYPLKTHTALFAHYKIHTIRMADMNCRW